MKSLILAIIFALLIQPSNARVGDTLSQCELRYGHQVPSPGKLKMSGLPKCYYFLKGCYSICVFIWDANVEHMTIVKTDHDALGRVKEMADEEIEKILKSAIPGSSWTEIGNCRTRNLRSDDGKFTAFYHDGGLDFGLVYPVQD